MAIPTATSITSSVPLVVIVHVIDVTDVAWLVHVESKDLMLLPKN